MDNAQKAFENMVSRKTNCAQAVFSALSKEYGLTEDQALAIAQGFGAGMGLTGRTCGAVSGAYMALGLSRKTIPANPREHVDKTYELMAEFDRRFKALHGSTNCTELTGYNLGIAEEAAKGREKGVFVTECPIFVRDAVKIVESLLK
jgi:C_GCAxxG_C_C family probable redox protein